MFPRSAAPLSFRAALLLVLAGLAVSRPLSRREAASPSAPRLVRRSPPAALRPADHQRRSLDDQEVDGDMLPLDAFELLALDSSNIRRSLDTEPAEPEALAQQKAAAEKEWAQFVAATPDEDSDPYADPSAQDDDCAANTDDDESKTPASPAPATGPAKGASPPNLGGAQSKPHSSDDADASKKNDAGHKDDGAPKKTDTDASQKNDADAAQKKDADAAQKNDADAAQKKDADAAQKKADAAQKKVDAEKQQQAEAEKQKQADAEKQQQAEAEKQKKDAAAAEAKKDAEAAEQAQKKQDANQLAATKPATVTTGTVHKDHSADSYSSPSSEVHTGDATFYAPDLGACGLVNKPTDYIVAVSHTLYDSFPSQGGNPNTNAVCGKRIRATYKGHSVEVTVADRCEGCAPYDLDFTITAFEQLGNKDEGRLHGMTWTFI